MAVKKPVHLKGNERKYLKQIISKGKEKSRKLTRSRILLMADAKKKDIEIINALETTRNTVRQIRKRYVDEGLEAAINERPRIGGRRKFSGIQRAKITALACSEAPQGRSRWTLRLIADRVVELGIAEEISYKSVGNILKKTN